MVAPFLEILGNQKDEAPAEKGSTSSKRLHAQLDGLKGSEGEVTAQFGVRIAVTEQLVLLHESGQGQAHFIER